MRIQNTPFGSNPFKRGVAIITAALFLSTGMLSYAPPLFAQSQSVNTQVQGGSPSGNLLRLDRDREIRIPPELGTVDEIYRMERRTGNVERKNDSVSRSPLPVPRRDKMIVFIQDAHDSLEAQENIAKIINHLVANYGVKTVFEEGYEGPVPTDKYFGFIKDSKIKEKVSYFLMDHLRVGGAEYAHINRTLGSRVEGIVDSKNKSTKELNPNPYPLTPDWQLIGADSLKLHKENVDQYRLSAAKKDVITKDLKALEKEFRSLADRRFPKELKEWLKVKEQFDAKKLDLFTYLGRSMDLLGERVTGNGPNTTQAERSGDWGRPNYHYGKELKSLDGERMELTPSTPGVKSRGNQIKHRVLSGVTVPLLQYILEAVKTNDPVVIEKAKHIDAREVFGELIKLEQAVAETYLEAAADKQLFEYYKILALLRRLNDLQVSQEEYEVVKASLKTFDTDTFARFIFSQAPKTLILSRMWERNIKDAIRFYEIAQERDHSLTQMLDRYFLGGGGKKKSRQLIPLV